MLGKQIIAAAAIAGVMLSITGYAYARDAGPTLQTSALSSPLASKKQIEAERRAIAIVSSEPAVAAKERIAREWKAIAAAKGGYDEVSERELSAAVDEAVLSSAIIALGANPSSPSVISSVAPPHNWFGVAVPGSRLSFDNPDSVYRFISVAPDSSYVIKGVRHKVGPLDQNFTLLKENDRTASNISIDDLVVGMDGNYVITVDASPADGRKNHIQLVPGSDRIFIRDTINDWGVQKIDSISVERLSGPPPAPQKSDEEIRNSVIGEPYSAGFSLRNDRVFAVPVNTIAPLTKGGANGRLVTQISSHGAFKLQNDEALVLTVTLGTAKYFVAAAYNRWAITTDVSHRTQTLNNKQALPNPDGSFTFVVSPKDPGVYNWIDTVGHREGFLNPRWQRLSEEAASNEPSVRVQLVKIAALPTVLPENTRFVTPHERELQRSERAAGFAKRYTP